MKIGRLSLTILLPALGLACSPATPSPRTPPRADAEVVAAPPDAAEQPEATQCEVVCEGAQVSTVTPGTVSVGDAESYTTAQTEDAKVALAAINDQLVQCYASRLRSAPATEGSVSFDILVGPDGHVARVDPVGGEKLGPARDCMEKAMRGASFMAPPGGGTSSIRVQFTLRRTGADEST
jgi:hypothetical protein